MKNGNTTFSMICSSINSIILGISLTSFNIIEAKTRSSYDKDSLISFEFLSSFAVSNIFLGGLLFTFFNKMKKEKSLIILSTIFNLIGYVAISIFPNLYCIFLARILIGMGCGCTCYVVPQYIFTLAPVESQGLWCSLHPINLNLGILIGQALTPYNTVDLWVIPYRSIVVFLLFLSFIQIFIQETDNNNTELTSIIELFRNKNSLKSIIIVSLLHISQHLSGVDYLSIYLPEILENNYTKILMIYSLTIPSVILSSFLLNRYGRKYLYLLSAGSLVISTIVLSFDKYLGCILFLFGYNMGISNIPWVVPNEATPDKFVSPITKLGIMCNWGSAYIILIVMTPVHKTYDLNAFFVYTTLMAIMVLFTLIYVPETKGNKNFL